MTDITQQTIQQQLALNSGSLSITNAGGGYQFIDTATGQPVEKTTSVSNYLLSNIPSIYQTSLKADVYNYALGIFGGEDVPPEVVDTLAAMATYYSVQTGQPVTSLFNQGVLLPEFLSTINSLRGNTSQIGYSGLNLNPKWENNVVLRASISKAIEPWDAVDYMSQRSKYDSKDSGFTFYAVDSGIIYVRVGSTSGTWEVYTPMEPVWPS
jgi:hypothetical protein